MSEAVDEYERRYMSVDERLVYREKVVSRGVFRATMGLAAFFGIGGAAAPIIAASAGAPELAALAFGVPFLLLGGLMSVGSVLFSVFRIIVTSAHLHVHFGWVKKKVPLEAISRVSIVTPNGIHQGKVSIGLDGIVRTWVGVAKSGRAVEVAYEDGGRKHVLTIGSEEPERFAAALEQTRGPRVRVETVEQPNELEVEASAGARQAYE